MSPLKPAARPRTLYTPAKDQQVWEATEKAAEARGVSLSSYVADVLRKHLGTEESSEHSTTQVSTFSTAVKVSVLTKGSIESPNGQALVIDLTVDGPGSLHEESVEIFDDKTGEIRLRIRPESNERN